MTSNLHTMTDPHGKGWYPAAAYLYVLHLDAAALAWEYLRRHPDYRRDWRHHYGGGDGGDRRDEGDGVGAEAVARRWGLCALENPDRDAREAHPAWSHHPAGIVQLHPDLAPATDAVLFDLWGIAGHKHLFHDGRHLRLGAWRPGRWQRFLLAPALEQGMPLVCAVPAGVSASSAPMGIPTACSRARPSRSALLEAHTLQALDATLAGATLREVAVALVGTATVAADWHADSALRAQVRRLVRRGEALMQGGYRRLLDTAYPPPGGR